VHSGKAESKAIQKSSLIVGLDEKVDFNHPREQIDVHSNATLEELKDPGNLNTRSDVKGKVLSCRICAKDFYRKLHLSNHLWRAHKQRDFACDICSQAFGRWTSLKLHVNKAHSSAEKEILTCKICDQAFPQKSQLFNHKWRVHKKKSYECDVCKSTFPTLKRLIVHKKKHDTAPLGIPTMTQHELECPVCPNKFGNDEILKRHIWIEHLGESLTCLECDKTFSNQHFIISHVTKVHNRKTESNILETNKFLSKLVGLIEEIKAEVSTRPSMFDSSAFLSKIVNNIKNEEVTEVQNLKTPISKSIKDEHKTDSDVSELIDTSVFKMHDPDFSLDNKDPEELKAYFNTCLDKFLAEAPVLPGCQMCPQKFTQNLSLFKHMQREHNIKCFTCQICDRRFIARKNLNEHYGSVHLPKKWKCGKCAFLFARKHVLERHVKIYHSGEHCKEELFIRL